MEPSALCALVSEQASVVVPNGASIAENMRHEVHEEELYAPMCNDRVCIRLM